MKKSQLIPLKLVASHLMKVNGSTTTLEIKEELRRRFPDMNWYQSDISQTMIDIYDSGDIPNLTFTDTGEFRLYQMEDNKISVNQGASPITSDALKSYDINDDNDVTLPLGNGQSTTVSVPKPKTLSRTAIVDLMKDSKGRFYTVTFIKKDKTERTINGQTKKDNFMDNLGYINFRESNGNHRRVNPQTIKSISISGQVYNVK